MRDRILGCLLIVLCGVVYWATLDLPPPTYEPLGPAAFPRMLAVVIGILAVPLILKPNNYERKDANDDIKPTPMMPVWLMLGAVVFAIVLQSRMVSFAITATAFLIYATAILTRFDRRGWLPTLILSPIIGFGLEYIFTRIFIIDLP